jgi:hypothetical protein
MSIELSPKLRQIGSGLLRHWCPACHAGHVFNIGEANAYGAIWSWDGDAQRPTFTPSMHMRAGEWVDHLGERHRARTLCHYTLIDGRITYCADSPHKFAGQTVDLPDFPPGRR